MSTHANIIIVGAGLVGSTLACALAQSDKNLSILVLEASSGFQCYDKCVYDPRVVALNPSSIGLLKSLNIWASIAHSACTYQKMSVWDGEGNGSIKFNSADIHTESLGSIIENSVVLKALRLSMAQYNNVQFLAPARVSNMTLGVEESVLTLNDVQQVTGDFIIAADGAKSILRELAGIATREWEYGHSAIVTTVRTEKPHQNTAWQRFSHQGPLAFLPLQDRVDKTTHHNKYCSIVWSLKTECSEQVMSLSDDAFCSQLTKTFEAKLGQVEWADTRYCIPLRQCNARHYGEPGFALVGDAAHTIHPLAGQGVNLGLADVMSLRDEITRARSRSVPLRHSSVVKRYQRTRKPQNLAAMAAMEGFKRLFGHQSLSVQSVRNRGMDWVDKQNWAKNLVMQVAG